MFICLKAIIYSIMLTTLYLTSHSKCRDKLIDYGWKFCPCTHLISARRSVLTPVSNTFVAAIRLTNRVHASVI